MFGTHHHHYACDALLFPTSRMIDEPARSPLPHCPRRCGFSDEPARRPLCFPFDELACSPPLPRQPFHEWARSLFLLSPLPAVHRVGVLAARFVSPFVPCFNDDANTYDHF